METFAKKRYAPREGSERSKADARGATKMAAIVVEFQFYNVFLVNSEISSV